MRQFNAYQFYDMGTILHPLENLQESAKLRDLFYQFFMAKQWLYMFTSNEILPFTFSKTAANKLWWALDAVIPSDQAKLQTVDLESDLGFIEVYKIKNGLKEFETVLSTELQSMNTYFISQTLAYNTSDLISAAENMLPESTRKTINAAATADIRQAGRCVAFDLPTGAGFHIMRATESVIRQLLQVLKAKPHSRNWGKYIDALKKHGVDAKILTALDQLRDLHRNPIMHPEVVLSQDEATCLIGLAQSVIVAMAADIDRRTGALARAVPIP